MAESLTPPFEELRNALQADGADLALEEMSGGVATVRLVLRPETCLNCIMPKETLEAILLAAFQQAEPAVERVNLIDPRPAP